MIFALVRPQTIRNLERLIFQAHKA